MRDKGPIQQTKQKFERNWTATVHYNGQAATDLKFPDNIRQLAIPQQDRAGITYKSRISHAQTEDARGRDGSQDAAGGEKPRINLWPKTAQEYLPRSRWRPSRDPSQLASPWPPLRPWNREEQDGGVLGGQIWISKGGESTHAIPSLSGRWLITWRPISHVRSDHGQPNSSYNGPLRRIAHFGPQLAK